MKKTHTPVPWKVYYAKNNGHLILGIGEENGQAITNHSGAFWGTNDEAKANSEFVVRACNNHYQLIDALENLLNWHETKSGDYELKQILIADAWKVIDEVKQNETAP